MVNILVTGANGYIGRNLTAHFAQEGHHVLALARHDFSVGPNRPQLKKIIDKEYNQPAWQGADIFNGVDVVVHAAARVHRSKDNSKPELYKNDNITVTMRLAEMAQQRGVKRFIFISSIGAKLLDDLFHQGRMSWDEAWRTSAYKASKLQAERHLTIFGKATGLEIIIVRLPMVYGKDAPGNFSKLVDWLQRERPLPVFGLHNPRAFVSIETVKDFFLHLLTHPRAAERPWSIRDKDEITSSEFAALTSRHVSGHLPNFLPMPLPLLQRLMRFFGFGDQLRSLTEPLHIDLTDTEKRLDWHPPFSVADGLRRVFQE